MVRLWLSTTALCLGTALYVGAGFEPGLLGVSVGVIGLMWPRLCAGGPSWQQH
jgi:hypothetical protein